jgi:hypothetical protein
MDGFMKGGASPGASQSKIPKITEASNLLMPKAASDKIRTAAQGVHNRAQRSQTLMRTAVKKPVAAAKSANSSIKVPDFKPRATNIDASRFNRAQSIDKNQKVRRFGHGVSAAQTQPAQQKPVQKAAVGEVIARQAPTQPVAKAPKSSSTSLIHKPLPSMVTSTSHQQLERMLDEALTRADSHKNQRRSHKPNQTLLQKAVAAPRWWSIGAAMFIVGIIAIFIAINKIPQVAVRVAAARAHISAEVPGYTPAGFSFTNPVAYSDGKVSMKFKANDSSAREFTVSQASSKMSSKSLEDKVVPDNVQVQTSVVNGTTVYIYGENNDAAWVNNGMQYTIKDAASLNSDQILKIANSL